MLAHLDVGSPPMILGKLVEYQSLSPPGSLEKNRHLIGRALA